MDFETYIARYNRFDRSGVRDYIKDVIQKDNHIMFYNKDFKEWMVQDRQTGCRKYLVIILPHDDRSRNTEFLLGIFPHPTPLLKTLYDIEHTELNKAWDLDNRFMYIADWQHYLHMVEMDVYSKQITEILLHRVLCPRLPQNIIDNTLALQQSVLDYIEKNKTKNCDEDGIELDAIRARLYEIVKNICSLTHYIIVTD